MSTTDHEETILGYCMAKVYSLVKGIQEFGENGLSSAIKEMSQLHDRICWKPRKLETLTTEEREKALESMLFLTPKRDGTIKGRTVKERWLKYYYNYTQKYIKTLLFMNEEYQVSIWKF